MKDPWIYRRRSPVARMRLFCLPHAGASASVYARWQDEFPEEFEVCAVELPGRRTRLREPFIRRVEPLVEAIAEGLEPHLDLPYALFGHSFGALLAFELQRHLTRVAGPEGGPRALFLSGASAPHLSSAGKMLSPLPDAEFLRELRGYGGLPDSLFGDPSMLDTFLPVLRADFEAYEHYRHDPGPLIDCPVGLFAGDQDQLAPPDRVAAWADLVDGPVSIETLPSGHFYVDEHRARITGVIARRLGRCLYRRPLAAVAA